MNSIKKTSFLFILISFSSCFHELDFDQAEDYSATPVITSSLVYFSFSTSKFADVLGGLLFTDIGDTTDFKAFNDANIKKYLIKIDFNFEVVNELNRAFTMELSLLDNNNNNITHSFQDLKVNANQLDFSLLESIDIATNPNLLNSSKFKFIIKLDDTITPLIINENRQFKFKSSVSLFLKTTI